MRFLISAPNRLRVLYILVLGVFAFLTVAGWAWMDRAIESSRLDGRQINVAGRQRMLSQRLTKCVLVLASAPDPERERLYAEQLADTLALLERSHDALIAGSEELNLRPTTAPDILQSFRDLEPFRAVLIDAARSALASPRPEPEFDRLLAAEREFLAAMDGIVSMYERTSTGKIEHGAASNQFIAIAKVVTLLLGAVLIMEPAIRALKSQGVQIHGQFETISRLALAIQQIEQPLVFADAKGRIQYVNDAFTELTKYDLNEAVGKTLGAFMQGPLTDRDATARIRDSVRRGESLRESVTQYTRTGTPVALTLDCQAVRDESRRLTGYVAAYRLAPRGVEVAA